MLEHKSLMISPVLRPCSALFGIALAIACAAPVSAQSGDQKGDQKAAPADAGKDQKRVDEYAEALRVLGGPAANPECVWLGRRVVRLMINDDLDTAFRHLDLYDRFGCPSGHIQAAFRCYVRQPPIDSKASESVNARVHACWINPTEAQAQTPPAAPAQAAQPPGTKSQ